MSTKEKNSRTRQTTGENRGEAILGKATILFFIIAGIALIIGIFSVYSLYETYQQYSTTGIDTVGVNESSKLHSWNFQERRWTINIPTDATLLQEYSNRSRNRPFDAFVEDSFDNGFASRVATELYDVARREGVNERDIPYFVVTFVQSLPYTEDNVTSNYDEYPRFPTETLLAGGGDCEDSSMLGAAFLRELQYNVALLEFSDHMALGVACTENLTSISYVSKGQRYCYFETTGNGWNVGNIPEKYLSETPKVHSITPQSWIEATITKTFLNEKETILSFTIKNAGSTNATNVALSISAGNSTLNNAPKQLGPAEQFTYTIEGWNRTQDIIILNITTTELGTKQYTCSTRKNTCSLDEQ